ncbi:MAG: hypothetical protein ACREDR_28275, partial [Blastocatellia bacterium]
MWKAFKWVTGVFWAGLFSLSIAVVSGDKRISQRPYLSAMVEALRGHPRLLWGGLIGVGLFALYARNRDQRKHLTMKVQTYSPTRGLKPSDVVNTAWYKKTFIERTAVKEARAALSLPGGVILIGKPLIGKTRCAYEVLKKMSGCYILM